MASGAGTSGDGRKAIAAAFTAGAAAGAFAAWLAMRAQAKRQQEHLQGHPKVVVDLAALSGGLPCGSPSLLAPGSPTASVSSYSLPPTPRVSNGRTFSRSSSSAGGSESGDTRLRMAFVVRRDLQWSRQKLAVMVSHATLALFKKLFKARNPALMQWELAKGPKVVLRAEDEAQLMAVLEAARQQGLPSHSIAESTGKPDAPRSRVILAIGPVPADALSSIASGCVLL